MLNERQTLATLMLNLTMTSKLKPKQGLLLR